MPLLHEHDHESEHSHEHDEPEHPHPVRSEEATVDRPSWDWAGMTVRILLTVVGAAGLIVSAFMDWIDGTTAVNLDVRSLWESGFEGQGETFIATVGFVAIVLGLLAIVGLAPRTGWLTRVAGALGIVLFVLFTIQVYRADRAVADIEPGAWVALAGGLVALIGGFFGARHAVVATPGPTVVESE